MAAPTLDGRLLCASGSAYGVTGNGVFKVDPTDVYYPGAGFLAAPATFVGGPDLIDACLVGTTVDGIVVAFRGTMPLNLDQSPTVRDWLDDFDADPIVATNCPGQVHQGFSNSLATIWPRALTEVKRLHVTALAAKPVLITGHSKGGAMAALAAWLLFNSSAIPVKVVTFAAAKPGDAAFRDAYNAKIVHTRYEYADDIVPHLPPSENDFLDVLTSLPLIGHNFENLDRFDYESVGALSYIDANGRLVTPLPPSLPIERVLSLVQQISRLRFHQIAADHSIGCGSGYMTAICPTGVCKQSLASLA